VLISDEKPPFRSFLPSPLLSSLFYINLPFLPIPQKGLAPFSPPLFLVKNKKVKAG